MKKAYDIYFKVAFPAVVAAELDDSKDLEEQANDILEDMTQDEIIRRIVGALNYEGVEVVKEEELEDE